MGTLTYDSGLTIYFNDWTLAHLQVAIGVKLHLRESFHLSWKDETDGDGGWGSIWIFPGAPLFFKFADGRGPLLDSKWVEALVKSANTPEGMTVMPEPRPLVRELTRQRRGSIGPI
ncbi:MULTISPECIES: ATP-dependent DNA ligase [Cryobacterium]|uniref:ATP-dependent DNA ligase n=1 Tax=Cryobacterium zongtaii TaxID=1259217 RepID=A0A2S3ZJV4_9MICO|nr:MULTISPECIES: ATP-dependent DNA ligase [Cryobacterium]POH64540.1 ATP-dependent DNA ligase [Cryobacterium zongtaii]POH68327.1 ATP-dependent DNA ligase [Cryobacterium zongtaii]TFC46250.1 ATP-dependent DNA ligase [Cryobacterium sp. TMN-39-2]